MIDLPRYTLTQTAYEGVETTLYRGHRDADGVPVAVKVTRSDCPTARELGRLRREFGVLEHIAGVPGVVRAYALEKCGRGLALVMEDLGDRSLHDIVKAQRLDLRIALQIAITLADTLSAIHHLSVIHKDIKPRNIMIDEATYTPRLIDFGIAARLSQETQKAASPAALEGTLAYLSPEQTGRMNRVVDLRSDLYSLGATLFEVLTGVVPFPAEDATELIHSHIARTPTPPHERAPEVPRPLSDLVMRLLSKMPEDRYQSARGLKADLEECLTQWEARGRISAFPLGRRDAPEELRMPQKLYGRQSAIEALLFAFERACQGASELVMVSGYSGVGKSALVNEIQKPIARQGGYFIRGKFDKISRDDPLAPVAHAFRELMQQILTEPSSVLEAWKDKLLSAVGDNGRLLCDLIPELRLILGPQPEVAVLGPTEAKNRFGLLVQRFVRVFARPEHPLVLFLDDLQWADAASLQMLSLLLSDPDSKHLAIVGAYRDNEVDAAHPLMLMIDELRKAGTAVAALTLSPLDLPTVNELIADALRARAPDVLPLAALLFDKTQGNPFFLGQLLRALYQEQIIRLDPSSGAFVWDQARVGAATATDNVVDFLVGKLRRLSPGVQRALSLAACIGHEFDLGVLATIEDRAQAEVAAELWDALREGLIVPQGGDYRLLDVSASPVVAPAAGDLHITYQFSHDRVLEAAYSLIEAERKAEVHLSIGRLLWARSGESPRDEDLLEIVRHLNLGARVNAGARLGRAELSGEGERLRLAELNLRAGGRARAATAFEAAAGYFRAGIQLLDETSWELSYPLCLALHMQGAECAHLSADLPQAEAWLDEALSRAKSDLERARTYHIRMAFYTTRARYVEAVKVGLAGLALLGVTLPETPAEQEAAVSAGLAEIEKNLRGRRIEDLIDAEVMNDPARELLLQMLCEIGIPIYFSTPGLFALRTITEVNISLRYGHSNMSAFGYMTYGFMLAHILRQPEQAYAFGQLALALNEKLPNVTLTSRLYAVFYGYVYLREPVRASLIYNQKAREAALSYGDFIYFSSGWYGGVILKFALGDPLEEVSEDIEKGFAVVQRTQDAMLKGTLILLRQVIANLQGRTRDRATFSDDSFDEDAFRAGLHEKNQSLTVPLFWLCKLHLRYLHGDNAGVVAAAKAFEGVKTQVFGMYYAARADFYVCLALLALPAAATPEEEERREQAVAKHQASIAELAAICPMNFEHQLLLIQSQRSRREGRHIEAIDLCDRAIVLARAAELPQDEALANELCGELYLGIGKAKPAGPYLTDAYLGYRRWGATAKAEDLAKDHGHVLLSRGGASGRGIHTTSSSVSVTSGTTLLQGTTLGSLRDAAVVVRAVQSMAGELLLPKVIELLMKLVLENAGAQRGALLLLREGRLFVEASFEGDPARIEVGPSVALDTRSDLAQSVPLFVTRTREPVVLDDASADRRFAGDPYVVALGARSILCLPLMHQLRLVGLIYLEHRDAVAAFSEAGVELLSLLASQAAIAIENARLVADVQEAKGEVLRANERLYAEVAERTEDLRRANRDLAASNQRLQVELAQREQAERERAALQEQMLEAQRARLLELSTPLIPISSHVVVMPIIGSMDAERAEQMLSVALTGAQEHRARVVIMDITGMRHIDTHVVGTLLRTAAALRLLGAQAVLTGIRPEVAQTMVALGANLETIVTQGTLQGGIAYALARVSGITPW